MLNSRTVSRGVACAALLSAWLACLAHGQSRIGPAELQALAGVREYPDGAIRALADLAADPQLIAQLAANPESVRDPQAAGIDVPADLESALQRLRDTPELIAIAAENPQETAALRQVMLAQPQEAQLAIDDLRERYARADVAAAAAWEELVARDPVALGEYRDLITQYCEAVLKEAPDFAVVEVLDRRYYAACPPDGPMIAALGAGAQTDALRRALEQWWGRFAPEQRDRLARGGTLDFSRNALAARDPDARRDMWRMAQKTRGSGVVGLLPVMLQPTADLDADARIARATVEHARLWSDGGAAPPPAAASDLPPVTYADRLQRDRGDDDDDDRDDDDRDYDDDDIDMDDLDDDDIVYSDVPVISGERRYVDVPVDTGVTYYNDIDIVIGSGRYAYTWDWYYGFPYPFFISSPAVSVYYPRALCTTVPGYVSATRYYHGLRSGRWYRDYTRPYRPALNPYGYRLPGNPPAYGHSHGGRRYYGDGDRDWRNDGRRGDGRREWWRDRGHTGRPDAWRGDRRIVSPGERRDGDRRGTDIFRPPGDTKRPSGIGDRTPRSIGDRTPRDIGDRTPGSIGDRTPRNRGDSSSSPGNRRFTSPGDRRPTSPGDRTPRSSGELRSGGGRIHNPVGDALRPSTNRPGGQPIIRGGDARGSRRGPGGVSSGSRPPGGVTKIARPAGQPSLRRSAPAPGRSQGVNRVARPVSPQQRSAPPQRSGGGR